MPVPMLKKLALSLCLLLYGQILAKGLPQNMDEALFVNRIADFWEEEEYQIAKNQMLEFLKLYPNSSHADTLNAALGSLFLRENNPADALACYCKISDAKIASAHYIYRLQCMYLLGWYATLADECEAYLENNSKDSPYLSQATHYLAISLYHMCMSIPGEEENMQKLALRAKPYFEILCQNPSQMDEEIAAAFAHLCSILKDFPKAASLYLALAERDNQEEMLFLAASIQAEYDKELAIQTFQKIANGENGKRQEAAFNCLTLLFDLKKYETILENKEEWIAQVPSDRSEIARLIAAKSFFALHRYSESLIELQLSISQLKEQGEAAYPQLKEALSILLETSYELKNLDSLGEALVLMETYGLNGEDIFRGKFQKARLLWQANRLEEAKNELGDLLGSLPLDHSLRPKVLLNLADVEGELKNWAFSREYAIRCLTQFPSFDEAAIAEERLIAASLELSRLSDAGKEGLVFDLQVLLNVPKERPLQTLLSWKFLQGHTLVLMKEYQRALSILLELENSTDFDDRIAKVEVLIALCYRDGLQDLPHFCDFAEKALLKESSSSAIDKGALHVSLFNAYLERSRNDPSLLKEAEEHLLKAFAANTPIEKENLLWLADSLSGKNNMAAISVLEHFVKTFPQEETELASIQLCKLYLLEKRNEDAVSLLKQWMALYEENPKKPWKFRSEAAYLLGEQSLNNGHWEEALSLFDSAILEKANLRTEAGAKAGLQSARLYAKMETAEGMEKALILYKDLILQKNISHEPIYLESALDYIDLQSRCHDSLTKKLSLLIKIKKDFESANDLLSADYHREREQLPSKNYIYQSYMHFLDAEILMAQSLLDENTDGHIEGKSVAKDLFLKVIEEKAHPSLVARAERCLRE